MIHGAGLHLKGIEPDRLDEAIHASGLAPAYVACLAGPWLSVYPMTPLKGPDGSLERWSVELSSCTSARVLGVSFDGAFRYVLADGGRVLDRHGVPEGARGNTAALVSCCRPGTDPEDLEPLLERAEGATTHARDRAPFEGHNRALHQRLSDLAQILSTFLDVEHEQIFAGYFRASHGRVRACARLVRRRVDEPKGLSPLRSWSGPLHEFFSELDRRLEHHLAHFEPGLPLRELRELERLIFPFELSEDWRAFYRWRNGTLNHSSKLPLGYQLYPLETALEQRRFYIEQLNGNPMWLPVATGDKCTLFTSLHRDHFKPPFIWHQWVDSPFLDLHFESLPGLLACGLDQLERVPPMDEIGWEDWRDRSEALRLLHNPSAKIADDEPHAWPRRLDIFADRGWPPAWRMAIGRTAQDDQASGPTTTIAELLARVDPKAAVIEARIAFLIGSGKEHVIRVVDATGELWLHCEGLASRDVQLNALCEIEVQATPRRRTFDQDLYFRAERLLMLEDSDGSPPT